ncbi:MULTISPECIES: L,D-transpeptidase family protein [Phenylobacterium]|uniref:Lipoprotein-anchoring transpeptidase ErfK/SrfK n=1 Tax=Phenylobacterium koreense TaxID=266125 RepID=A0ABV2EHI2_9CAUL
MIRPVGLCLAGFLAACSPENAPASSTPPAADDIISAPALPPASEAPVAQAVQAARLDQMALDPEAARGVLIRAQVLLDRAHFSPGVIDGAPSEAMGLALTAFQQARGLPVTSALDPATWDALTRNDEQPVLADYVITEADVQGPFVKSIPRSTAQMAKLRALSYSGPLEALAEKFHMDEALLQALNPGVDVSRPGQSIVVARVTQTPLPVEVTRVEVDKSQGQVRAFDAQGGIVAVYPATVGSADNPAPTGDWAVRAVAENPTWNYDPARLSFGEGGTKKVVAPGPNNPVGVVWIALTKDTYGIHGSPEPKLIGKTASHGCVRLTNWDATQLGRAVRAGTIVTFVGDEAAG